MFYLQAMVIFEIFNSLLAHHFFFNLKSPEIVQHCIVILIIIHFI